MKIIEARQRIEELETIQKDALNLQDFCMDKDVDQSILSTIRKDAPLSIDLRTFATLTAQLARHEIDRIQHIIDNTEIKI